MGLFRDQDSHRPSRELKPGGQVHHPSQVGVGVFQFTAYCADRHRAGVQAKTHREIQAVLPAHLLGKRLDAFQGLQGCPDGAQGIILVRHWSPEESQHGIAQQAGDGAFIAINRRRNALQRGVDQSGPGLQAMQFEHGG